MFEVVATVPVDNHCYDSYCCCCCCCCYPANCLRAEVAPVLDHDGDGECDEDVVAVVVGGDSLDDDDGCMVVHHVTEQ